MVELRSLGLGRWPRPLEEDGSPMDPRLPPDITRVTDEELFRLYGQFCAMAQWVGFQLGIVQTQKLISEQERERLKSRLWLAETGNREDRKAKVDSNADFQRAENEALVKAALEGMTYPVFNGYLIGKEATSRELTRRLGADWERKNFGGAFSPRVPSRRG